MKIKKVNIENLKCFKGKFTIGLNDGINILVGNNEAGKSTILEAIHLALTGLLYGRYLRNELSQYLFNIDIINNFLEKINNDKECDLPHILIEVFFYGNDNPILEGNNNSDKEKAEGVSCKIEFDENYKEEYENLIKNKISTIPIEYYKITWKSFARETITSRSIPIKSVIIDSSSYRFQNGSDIYIARIIKDNLDNKQKASISQAYRKLKEIFMEDESIKEINKKIQETPNITEKDVKISVDLSTKNAWETTLMTYLNEIPFHQIGKGEQCIIKTNLALSHKKNSEANLILLEEPENHLSHAKLNEFVYSIISNHDNKQIIISTHSSFVANKLGLENLLLLNNRNISRLNDLSVDTYEFFKKLSGFETLRLVLSKKTILVEGPSDELIVQKAYQEKHGKLPIEDEIDIISVKLTFKRFLEIAKIIEKPVAVVTDNDGKYEKKITNKYKDYSEIECITIFADDRNTLNTLEPQFVDANKSQLETLCNTIDIDFLEYDTIDKISEYMQKNKTDWALSVFESAIKLNYPDYINRVIEWCNE
ncbi:MAG: AAA family ATPase [Bacteroidetes bacterium]|jgi:putative ATP-dependent endonuclease of the OLD family|nr:AAA family ATPase [Bacteroidota bacterium]MBT6687920.1 AAA family ATPase [Bacteroidota bacterium]MBT7142432.1 AAA family ATPase [Bacteroidota bacterium]MBT7490061.1 AAA family ATPase [Bacteroidota bacterium]